MILSSIKIDAASIAHDVHTSQFKQLRQLYQPYHNLYISNSTYPNYNALPKTLPKTLRRTTNP